MGRVFKNRVALMFWMARPWNSLVLDTMVCITGAVLGSNGFPPLTQTLTIAISCAFIHSAGTILNDYTDIEIDKIINSDRPLLTPVIKRRDALYSWGLMAVISITLSFFVGVRTFAILLLLLVFGIIYSTGPRIKNMFILNEVFIGFSFTLEVIASVFAVNGQINNLVLFYGLGFASLCIGGRSVRSLIDYKTDKLYGKSTYPSELGKEKALRLISVIMIVGYPISILAYLLGGLHPIFPVSMILLSIWMLYYSVRLALNPSSDNARKIHELIRIPAMFYSITFIIGKLIIA
jgi:4-hydroxybenzoate polyprenyltransferase